MRVIRRSSAISGLSEIQSPSPLMGEGRGEGESIKTYITVLIHTHANGRHQRSRGSAKPIDINSQSW
jgi:hypothetical protein